jgi:predicted carbohydrate-binding protein with CBM48
MMKSRRFIFSSTLPDCHRCRTAISCQRPIVREGGSRHDRFVNDCHRSRRTLMPATFQTEPGSAHPLGVTVCKDGVNFSLFSEGATEIVLVLFDSSTATEPIHLLRTSGSVPGGSRCGTSGATARLGSQPALGLLRRPRQRLSCERVSRSREGLAQSRHRGPGGSVANRHRHVCHAYGRHVRNQLRGGEQSIDGTTAQQRGSGQYPIGTDRRNSV